MNTAKPRRSLKILGLAPSTLLLLLSLLSSWACPNCACTAAGCETCCCMNGMWAPECDPLCDKRLTQVVEPGDDLFVAGAAHVLGANNTVWRTDLEVYSTGATAAVFDISLLVKDADNSSPSTASFEIAPGEARRFNDVLDSVFSFSGVGALRLTPISGALAATSRTYNQADTGTFGQFISGVVAENAVSPQTPGRIVQLSHSSDQTTGFRTNIGFVNLTSIATTVQVNLFLANGTAAGAGSYALPPFGTTQVDKIFERLGTPTVEDGYAVVSTATTGAAVFAFASIVDNTTGDPIFVPITPLEAEVSSGAREYYIPAAAHVRGTIDTNWRTDLEIHNPGETSLELTIELLPHGQSTPTPEAFSSVLQPGHAVRYTDAVASLFDFDGAAAIRVVSDGQAVVSSRTYNLTSNGTYGQFIGGTPLDKAITSGETGVLIQLSERFTDDQGYRTNIGFLNPGGLPVTVDATYHTGDGTLLDSQSYSLEPYSAVQMNRAYASATASDVDDGFIVLSTSSQGGFFAYASVIDNRTADPIYVPAIVIPAQESPQSGGGSAPLNMLIGLLNESDDPERDLQTTLSGVAQLGTDWLLDIMSVADNEVVDFTRTPDGLRADFGGFSTEGSWTLSLDEIENTDNHVRIDYSFESESLVVGGGPSPITNLTGTIQFDVTPEGYVVGDITAEGSGDEISVSANAHVDTEVCRTHPVSGTVTASQNGHDALLEFREPCGSYALDIPGAPAFKISPSASITMPCDGGPDYGDMTFFAVFRADGEIRNQPVKLLYDACETSLGTVRSGSGSGTATDDMITIDFSIDDDWTAYGGGTWNFTGRFEGVREDIGVPIPVYRGTLTLYRSGVNEYDLACEGSYTEEGLLVTACYSDHAPYCTNADQCP